MVTVCYGLMAIICIARNRSIWCNVVLLVRTTGDIWWGFNEIYDTKSTIFGFAQQMGDTPQWQLSLEVYPVFKQTHFSTHCNKGSELENGRINGWVGFPMETQPETTFSTVKGHGAVIFKLLAVFLQNSRFTFTSVYSYKCVYVYFLYFISIIVIIFTIYACEDKRTHVATNFRVCENQYVYVFILSYISTCVYHRPNFKRYWGKFISISRLKILKFVQMLKVVCCVCSTVKYKNVITM